MKQRAVLVESVKEAEVVVTYLRNKNKDWHKDVYKYSVVGNIPESLYTFLQKNLAFIELDGENIFWNYNPTGNENEFEIIEYKDFLSKQSLYNNKRKHKKERVFYY